METHDSSGDAVLSVLKCQVSIRKTKLERFRMLFAVLLSPDAVLSLISAPLDEGKSEEDVSVNLDTAAFLSSIAERAAAPSPLIPGTPSAVLYVRLLALLREIAAPKLIAQCLETPSGAKKMETAITSAIDGGLGFRSIVYVAFDSQPADAVARFFPARPKKPAVAPVSADNAGIPEQTVSDAVSIVHNCVAVIDPVEGKNASKLGKGDVIEVELPKDSGIYEMIAKSRSDFDGVVAGHVESVDRNGKAFSIAFTIAEGLRGIAELDGNYKIRLLFDGYAPDTSASLRRELWLAPTVVFASLIALASVVLYIMTH